MLFNSAAFLLFLPVVLVVYYGLNKRAQNVWLLAASWFFYGWWDYRFLSLIIISTIVDYFCARGIEQARSQKSKRTYLLCSVVTNLSILGFFKYYNFFADSAADLLRLVGFEPSMMVLQILLPMGISFYTFQTMAYTIDVYRGKQKPTRSLVNFALYVSYFPQLVAGPIERASQLLPQLENKRTVDAKKISEGLILILFGFFKKVAIADVAAPIVNQIFSDPGQYGAGTLILGVYLFAVQIYCDFSGYTDIARGVSRLLGIDLMVNFQHPYFATSITDFWRRWHISLSTWLRDYLYIPLGGNRKGKLNTYRNLMITMLLGGLWHGASWNFVIWGALHGIYLSIDKLVKTVRQRSLWFKPFSLLQERMAVATPVRTLGLSWHWKSAQMRRISALLGGIFTFHLVCFTWIFFRADSFDTTMLYLGGFADWSRMSLGVDVWSLIRLLPSLVLLIFIDVMQYVKSDHTAFRTWPVWQQVLLYLALLVCLFTFGAFDEEVPFIYFQF